MEIFQIPTVDVRPYPNNPRKNAAAVAKVATSLREFGFRQPIVVDEKMVVIVGHTRLEAAKQLGLADVPVHIARGLTAKQVRAYRLADNRTGEEAEWDFDKLRDELEALQVEGADLELTGFDDDELARALATETEGFTDPDAIPALDAAPVATFGDVWLLGGHRLMCGDSLDPACVALLMAGERASLFSTDPPYAVNYDGGAHPSSWANEGRANKDKDWSGSYREFDDIGDGREFYRKFIKAAVDCAIKDDAAWYCWHASKRQKMLEEVWSEFGAFMHQQIIWVKSRPVLNYSLYMQQHEPCLVGWVRPNKPRTLVMDNGLELKTTVWNVASNQEVSKDHPTSKPVVLFQTPIEAHTIPGETIYEPFSGSGTSLIAAEKTGRRCCAMELAPQFVDVAIRRWQLFTGKDATLKASGKTFAEVAKERGVS